ncbi:PfkB family carbohydrate kinase, partial [Candidatus Symbiothrix dinenymphae]|uniref:PfkB family carbohydrate kinase n=1 Tax=Candidatus Symbiothrix dinenymphae TaxID=467085 RepID=UPI000A9F14EB
ADDVILFGSYFAVNHEIRSNIHRWLGEAHSAEAVIYYDINFRAAHADERAELMPAFEENFECATVVRCSDEDLAVLYPNQSIDEIYRTHIAPRCKNLIVTQGAKETRLFTPNGEKSYPVQSIKPISTIGAGDNFNAGFIYALMQQAITKSDLENLPEQKWNKLLESAHKFAAEVCQSLTFHYNSCLFHPFSLG